MKPETKQLVGVLIAGAIGGFLSWVYSVATGHHPPLPWYGWIPSSVALGVGASFLGVYLLANSDLQGTKSFFRGIAFAGMCGFAWKPIYDAGGALVEDTIQKKAEQRALSRAEDAAGLASSLPQTPQAELPAKISETKKAAMELLDKLPEVHDREARQKVESATTNLVSSLREVKQCEGAACDPNIEAKKIDAYDDVGHKALDVKNWDVWNVAVRSLRETNWSAANQKDAQLKIRELTAQSPNTSN